MLSTSGDNNFNSSSASENFHQTDLVNTQLKKKVKKDNAVLRSANLGLFFTTALDLSYVLFRTRGI